MHIEIPKDPCGYFIEDTKYPGMYRIRFPDGGLSEMYNETRCREFIRRLTEGNKETEIRVGYAPFRNSPVGLQDAR